MKLTEKKIIFILCFFGLFLRVLFTLFFAEDFFHRNNIYVDGDTNSWLISFNNLIETGSFSANLKNEYGYFFRMPGYSFFIGIWSLIFGTNSELLFPFIGWFQVFLDIGSIFLIYKVSIEIFKNSKIALITAFLYSSYPFIIVWNPVVYSESVSIFTMLLSLFLLVKGTKVKYVFWSGIVLGLGILFRPQLIFLILIYGIVIIGRYRSNAIKPAFYFIISIIISYGLWPIRNIVNHNKIIFTQDLRGANNWNIDVIAFMQYVYSVKNEWEPQFSSILQNKKVEWPEIAFTSVEDSVLLEKTILLCKTCGSGFSFWNGYYKKPIVDKNCNVEIKQNFDLLRKNQIKRNPINYYLKIPLYNLKKAMFKTDISNKNISIRNFASNLFYYRTMLILFGLLGFILIFRNNLFVGKTLLLYIVLLYITLCFGTSHQMRNIEMRYFLHADVLLLLPASYFILELYKVLSILIRVKR